MIDKNSELFYKPDQRTFKDSAINFTLGKYKIRFVTYLEAEFRWIDVKVIFLTIIIFAICVVIGSPICMVGTLVAGFFVFLIAHHTYIGEVKPQQTIGEAIKTWKNHINENNQVFEQCFICNKYGFFDVEYEYDYVHYKCPNCKEVYEVRL